MIGLSRAAVAPTSEADVSPRRRTGPRGTGVLRRWWRSAAAIGALAALAGCDDGVVISKVDRLVTLDRARVVTMAGAENRVPLVIYGELWSGVAAETVAERLRPPNDFPPNIGFRRIDPSDPASRDPDLDKLVLIFNPDGPPRPRRVCDLTLPAPSTRPAQDGPFEAVAVFCNGRSPMGEGVALASRQTRGDWDEFVRVMRVLFATILADYSGRSER